MPTGHWESVIINKPVYLRLFELISEASHYVVLALLASARLSLVPSEAALPDIWYAIRAANSIIFYVTHPKSSRVKGG
jgi:hypothetical protein